MTKLIDVVNEYLAHLQYTRCLSTNTIYAYRYDLKKYTYYLSSYLGISTIDAINFIHIEKFVKSINNDYDTGSPAHSPLHQNDLEASPGVTRSLIIKHSL